ncbi:MAG: hypothetical protein SFY80_09315 [Verrucomicrobiota bacterium]|nr:hypothetical protein [Verrucomicrobiota bacterium]
MKTAGPVTTPAPQIWISLPFFIFGFTSLGIGLFWLLCNPTMLEGHYYKPELLSWTHLIVLGWLVSMVVGAAYQLVPVITGRLLWSPLLAGLHAAIHIVCLPGMVLSFQTMDFYAISHWGSALFLGLLLFIINILVTAGWRARRSIPALGLVFAVTWLGIMLTVVLYALAAKYLPISKHPPFRLLQLHAHLGFGGFLLMTLMGAAYRLIPMFTLSPAVHPWRAGISLASFNLALIGLSLTLWFGWLIALPWIALLAAFSIILFLTEISTLIRNRKRRLDWGLRLFLFALYSLVPVMGFVLWQAFVMAGWMTAPAFALPQTYFLLTALCVLSLTIFGMAGRILPFLIWHWRYSVRVGHGPVPLVHELTSPSCQRWSALALMPATLLLAAGMVAVSPLLLQLGTGLFLVGFIINGVNLALLARHAIAPIPRSDAVKTTSFNRPQPAHL